jgi:putative transposase
MTLSALKRKDLIRGDASLSIRKQFDLISMPRSSYYYTPVEESKMNLKLMRLIDEQYMKHPYFGCPRMTDWLVSSGYHVNHKRVSRLMKLMGIQAITPGPHTSKPSTGHKIYPYLLRGVSVDHPDQVWSTDFTYIPMKTGFLYLTAIIDWYSRYILSWELSSTMENTFCILALEEALRKYKHPDVFNTDQGSQYTSEDFTHILLDQNIVISMDGKGRALDNVFIERFWWTIKYENIYPSSYDDGHKLFDGLARYIKYYNEERSHSSIGKKTPSEVYFGGGI